MEKSSSIRKNKESTNSQVTPRSNRTPGRYTSPFKNNKTPVTKLFHSRFDEFIDEDVNLLRKEERSIYDLNDQNIALARVVSNQLSEISILKNQNRIARMDHLKAKKVLDDRKSQALLQQDEYNDAMSHFKRITAIKEGINNEIESLRQIALNIQAELKDIYSKMQPEDPEAKQQYQLLNFEVTQYRAQVEFKRKRVHELKQLQEKYMSDIENLSNQFTQLEEEYRNLKAEREILHAPYEKVLNVFSTSFDPLTNESAYVKRIEKEVEEWSQKLSKYRLSETTDEVNRAQSQLEALQKENDERKQELNQRKEDLAQANLKFVAASKAVSSTTRYKTTVATTKNTRIKRQHDLAIEIVKDIFRKISQKEENVNKINQEVAEMIEKHQKSQDPIIDEYNQKMAKVEELTRSLSEIDSIIIDIARVANERDELKKEEDDMKYELDKYNHVSSNLQKDQEKISERQNENLKIQEAIEKKKQEYDEFEKEIQEKKKKIEEEKAIVEQMQNEYLEKLRESGQVEDEKEIKADDNNENEEENPNLEENNVEEHKEQDIENQENVENAEQDQNENENKDQQEFEMKEEEEESKAENQESNEVNIESKEEEEEIKHEDQAEIENQEEIKVENNEEESKIENNDEEESKIENLNEEESKVENAELIETNEEEESKIENNEEESKFENNEEESKIENNEEESKFENNEEESKFEINEEESKIENNEEESKIENKEEESIIENNEEESIYENQVEDENQDGAENREEEEIKDDQENGNQDEIEEQKDNLNNDIETENESSLLDSKDDSFHQNEEEEHDNIDSLEKE